MEKAMIAPHIPERRNSKNQRYLRVALVLALQMPSNMHSSKVPIDAHQIIEKCANLNTIPGPPLDFDSRKESDRYVAGTKPTLIKNATMWTGNMDGLEVIPGDLLLDKGMIQAVGEVPAHILNTYHHLSIINANGSWVSPGIIDLHSHLGDQSSPKLRGAADTNSRKGLVQPWLRSLDSLNTHDDAYRLSIAGGVTTAVILPGSANAIDIRTLAGGQAFVIKLRPTEERSPSSMLLEPPFTFNGSGIDEVQPPRWRQLKQACGRVYSGTRMDTIWAYRQGYEEARKLKVKQDAFCEKAVAGQWDALGKFPQDLQWEALVDVLRGKVKIQNHCYEAVDLDGIVRLTNEFKFPIAAFHHAHETYLVPDLLKKAYGHTPAVALFATKARYKRESYRGSEFAPRILADNGIQVVMKSDHPVLNSRFLMHEAQQAHYFGLAENLALASVTSTPAQVMGQEHRIGYIRKGYDADVILWDSHPLAIGAAPKQVFIDGVAQLENPFVVPKSEALQHAPKIPDFEEETKAALKYDGLPPLEPKESVSDVVIFQNFKSLFLDMGDGVEQIFTAEDYVGEPLIAVVQKGDLSCVGTSDVCSTNLNVKSRTINLHGGSLAPGLLSFGSRLGLVHIAGETTTQDGEVFDSLSDKVPSVLGGDAAVIRALDGLQFATRDALLAYRSGVTTGIAAPCSSGLFAGLSAAFNTGAAHKLIEGAVMQDEVALHVSLSLSSSVSVSTQIATLRTLLSGGAKGELGVQISKVLEGKIPLVIGVHNADIMASLIQLKAEIEKRTGSPIRMTFVGASEAHMLANEIGVADVGVIISPARPFPSFWDMRRILPGPPLTQHNAISILMANNVTVGVGVEADGAWAARHTRFDVSWAALEAGGKISNAKAIALISSNLERLLGLQTGTVSSNLVATTGGTILDFESKFRFVYVSKNQLCLLEEAPYESSSHHEKRSSWVFYVLNFPASLPSVTGYFFDCFFVVCKMLKFAVIASKCIIFLTLLRLVDCTVITSDTSNLTTSSFEYIIAGGGTTALAVANRLAVNHSVLVVERGPDLVNDEVINDPFTLFGTLFYLYAIISAVIKACLQWELPGRKLLHQHNDWFKAYIIYRKYIQKSETFHPPNPTQHAKGADFIAVVHGFDGPVGVSFAQPLMAPTLQNAAKNTTNTVFEGAVALSPDMGDGFSGEPTGGGTTLTFNVSREIIVSAGTLYSWIKRRIIIPKSPAILQRSGIGNATFLKSLGIEPVLDLPGVGANFQDQILFTNVSFPLATSANITNVTGGGEILLAVVVAHPTAIDTLGSNEHAISTGGIVTSDALTTQAALTADAYQIDRATAVNVWAQSVLPLSRGTIHINTTDTSVDPIADAQYLTTEVDMVVAVAAARKISSIATTLPFSDLLIENALAEANVPQVGASDEEVSEWVLSTYTPGTHPIGSNSMMPRELGGVVSPQLLVYGTTNLRIADASIIPMSVFPHTTLGLYGVAEKAADMILEAVAAEN
ncbi:hypothetical protein J3R30DRAFT_3403875 [Lentinula aciculospora]|uniref:Carbohydrate esterase family 9 protein n=1 Tax=Lentinula aciculospora TaxID=153920 RepID=A0A9W9DNQ2_9AGAR|nr:hypothetical protein J3R30DRAFT_3403875 [Lentinula aciculospora]